jgi:N-acetylmuramoyl-L-alanine amidase
MKKESPNQNALREPRIGAMLHYPECDFVTAVNYCCDASSKVSYNAIIAPDGAAIEIVPRDRRAWHAGVCRPSQSSRSYEDANSAFYGIAIAGGPEFGPPTDAQEQTLNSILWDLFEAYQWPVCEWYRIVGHDTEAYPRGRKIDPTGHNPGKPWLSLQGVRDALCATQP